MCQHIYFILNMYVKIIILSIHATLIIIYLYKKIFLCFCIEANRIFHVFYLLQINISY